MKLGLHVYNRNESSGPWWKTAQWTVSPTVRGRYLGTLFKGWWTLGRSSITDYLELEIAIGGEDNMVQAGVVLPFLGRVHVGVRVPRRLTSGWIYERREWTLRIGYVGHWLDLMFAADESMRSTGMDSYYRDQLARGTYSGPWSRAALWPGWHLTINLRLRDRLLGSVVYESHEGEPVRALVPMPEGGYPCTVKLNTDTWTRPRWPWSRKVVRRADVELDVAIPTPGKGENSWDIDDGGISSQYGPASSVAAAVAHVTESALRDRERYASRNWVPDAGWPTGIRLGLTGDTAPEGRA